MTTLVGLGGYAYAGKDAVADVLEDHGWFRTYMSSPLERALVTLNPFIEYDRGFFPTRYAEFHKQVGYSKSKRHPEVRRLLQSLGTEVGRDILGKDVWLNAVFKQVEEAKPRPAAVTGIRYHNELDRIRSEGGVAVWVSRPGYGPINGHSSDNTLGPQDFDLVLHNNGTLDDLAQTVLDSGLL